MNLIFECVERGKTLYKVPHSDGVTTLFIGTRDECGRFIVVYQERKEYHAREEAFRTANVIEMRERREMEHNYNSRKRPARVVVRVRA